MARLVSCDSCRLSTEDVSDRLVHPVVHRRHMGNQPGQDNYAGDRWAHVTIIVMREIPFGHAEFLQSHRRVVGEGEPPEETRFLPLETQFDLCPECAERMFQANSTLTSLIQRDPPAPPPEVTGYDPDFVAGEQFDQVMRYDNEPRKVEIEDEQRPSAEASSRTGWERIIEDDAIPAGRPTSLGECRASGKHFDQGQCPHCGHWAVGVG